MSTDETLWCNSHNLFACSPTVSPSSLGARNIKRASINTHVLGDSRENSQNHLIGMLCLLLLLLRRLANCNIYHTCMWAVVQKLDHESRSSSSFINKQKGCWLSEINCELEEIHQIMSINREPLGISSGLEVGESQTQSVERSVKLSNARNHHSHLQQTEIFVLEITD